MNDIKLCEIVSKKLRNKDKILDVGCGEGFIVNCLAKELNRKIVYSKIRGGSNSQYQ